MKTPSTIHSALMPAQMSALALSSEQVTEQCIHDLAQLGISFDSSHVERIFSHLVQGEGIRADKRGLGMDADLTPGLTVGSVTTPVQFAQAWLPGTVRVVTSPRVIDELIGIVTQGDWADEEIVASFLGNSGEAQIYSDNGNVPMANWNLNFIPRTIVRLEMGLRVGILEQERAAKVRIDSAAEKRFGVIEALEIGRNKIGFYGFNDGTNKTYGMLNDPQLLAYETLPTGDWTTAAYLEIIDDLIFMAATLQTQSDGRIDPKKAPITLAIAVVTDQYLNTSTEFGNTSVRRWIKETYPNWTIKTVPQFEAANGGQNVAYLYSETVDMSGTDNSKTFTQIVPTKFRSLGIEQRSKGYVEDYSNATAGSLCKRPYATARFTNL